MAETNKLAVEGGVATVPINSHRVWPEITQEDRSAIQKVLDVGRPWGATAPETVALQREWAEYVGVQHCLAVNSGTAALHCGLTALGLRPGDEVIVPAFTFIASAMAVAHQGAVPVFCDIDLETYNIDVAQIEDLVTERTRAIMPVHIHGLSADMDGVNQVAARHGLSVIEDAAQAHGATYKGKKTGALAACAAFSLNGTKNFSAAEGGLFVTDDEEAFLAARRLALYGEDAISLKPGEFRSYWSHGVGYNYRTTEFTAALARSQMRRLDGYNETARRNAEILTEGLSRLPGIIPPQVPKDRTSVYHKYRFRLDPSDLGFDGPLRELRDRLFHALYSEGVNVAIWQSVPIPAHPVFRRPLSPWRPELEETPLESWHPEKYSQTIELLDGSIVLGNELHPLYVQDAELMKLYLQAFEKVFDRLDALLESPYEPVQLRPMVSAIR